MRGSAEGAPDPLPNQRPKGSGAPGAEPRPSPTLLTPFIAQPLPRERHLVVKEYPPAANESSWRGTPPAGVTRTPCTWSCGGVR